MSTHKSSSFFDKYASEYDAMTDAHLREPKHRVEVEAMISRFSPTSVLDAGCATGLTARLFAEKQIDTVGVDSSAEMIRLAHAKSGKGSSSPHFQVARFEALPAEFRSSFDLIVCLGNSISGVASEAILKRVFRNFRRALKPSGWLVLQMLNPSVIVKGEVFGVKVSRTGDILYHRYATRPDDRVSLHVIRTDLSLTPPTFETFVHSYRLLTAAQFAGRLREAGFGRVAAFSSLAFAPISKKSPSRDLVIVAQRTS